MVSMWRAITIRNLVIALLLIPAVGMAADYELFWDPNCNEDNDMEGYSIYYIEEESVILHRNDATEIYVPLSQNGFDSDAPGYLVSGLFDDVTYCFAVSAWYGNEESGMSNEICGLNGVSVPSPGSRYRSGLISDSTGGCFINVLK